MLKDYSRPLGALFQLFELLAMAAAFLVVYSHTYGVMLGWPPSIPLQYQALLAVEAVLWVYVSGRLMLYKSKRTVVFKREMLDVFMSATICMSVAAVTTSYALGTPADVKLLVALWAAQSVALVAFRLGLREFLKAIRKRGFNYKQVLIVGHNSRVDELVDKIESSPELGLQILGYVDTQKERGEGSHITGYEYLGGIENLEKVVREKVVDEVFVFLPIKSFYCEIEKILNLCEEVGVEVELPTDLFMRRLAKSSVLSYDGITLISLYTSPRMDWRLVLKRAIDVVVSGTALLALLPLFALVAVLIKATSSGPVIFRQRRKGYNGRVFDCLKFRTMVENAEAMKKDLLAQNEMDGPVFKMKSDPRITKIGRILRKTSMDELPQLINVLMGDMSLVGPRPPLPDEVSLYERPCLRRLSMKPGITCLWQVSGRNDVPFEKWMELDRDYIDHWSLWLDFKILLKTIPVVLKSTGR